MILQDFEIESSMFEKNELFSNFYGFFGWVVFRLLPVNESFDRLSNDQKVKKYYTFESLF